MASLILGAYYKLNWSKRASAVYWLLGTLLYPWDEEREREREAHAVELEALREEQSRREEEVKKKCKKLEEKQELQASIEAKVLQQREELERKKIEEEGKTLAIMLFVS